jgi:Caspase domain
MGSGALYGPGGRPVGQNPAPGRPTRGERVIIETLARFAKAHGCDRGRVPADAVTVCALAAVAWFVIAGAAQAETRVALVIGNSNYAAQRLKNPRNDAALMARTLAGVGFEVMTLMDASAADMRSAITEFGRRRPLTQLRCFTTPVTGCKPPVTTT